MTDASTTGAVESIAAQLDAEDGCGLPHLAADTLRALVAERDALTTAHDTVCGALAAAIRRAEAAEERADKADAALRLLAREIVIAARRVAPTEGEAQSLDDTTRAVLDRAERIVAGQSQQEQRTAEIFLRPTEGEA